MAMPYSDDGSVAINKAALTSTNSKFLSGFDAPKRKINVIARLIVGAIILILIVFFGFHSLPIAAAILAVLGILLILYGWRQFSLMQQVEGTPATKIEGAAEGLNEIYGVFIPESAKPLKSPLSGSECVYCQLDLQQLVHTKNGSYWSTIRSYGYGVPSLFTDNTGYLAVDLPDSDISIRQSERQYIVDGEGKAVFVRDTITKNLIDYLSGPGKALPDLSASGAYFAPAARFKFELFGGDQVSLVESYIPTGTQYFAMGRVSGTSSSIGGKAVKLMTVDPNSGILTVRQESKIMIEVFDKLQSIFELSLGILFLLGGLAYLGFA
ncbi:MAG: hypothetical protein KGH72_01075 [Candidatus Micrarchaeota archaeon]|nr:hypothetical protein [Candidatus Micrarchaeota archaeon]